MDIEKQQESEVYSVGNFVDYLNSGWVVRIIEEKMGGDLVCLSTFSVNCKTKNIVNKASTQLQPFRTSTEKQEFQPYQHEPFAAVQTRLTKHQSAIETLLRTKDPASLSPVYLIQLLRGRYFFDLNALFQPYIETLAQLTLAAAHARTHFALLLYFLNHVSFAKGSIYLSGTHAFCSIYPELYANAETILASTLLHQPQNRHSLLPPHWQHQFLSALYFLCTGRLLSVHQSKEHYTNQSQQKEHRINYLQQKQPNNNHSCYSQQKDTTMSIEPKQSNQIINKKTSKQVRKLSPRITNANIQFLTSTMSLVSNLLSKQILRDKQGIGIVMQALYCVFLTKILTQTKDPRELKEQKDRRNLESFSRMLPSVLKLLPETAPCNLMPYIDDSTESNASKIYHELYSCEPVICSKTEQIQLRTIYFRLLVIDSFRLQLREKEYLMELYSLVASQNNTSKWECIMAYIKSREIIKNILDRPCSEQIRSIVIILAKKLQKQVFEALISCRRVGVYGKHIMGKLSIDSLSKFIDMCEQHRLQMKALEVIKQNNAIERNINAINKESDIDSNRKGNIDGNMEGNVDSNREGNKENNKEGSKYYFSQNEQSYQSVCLEYLDLYKYIQGTGIENYPMSLKVRCQRIILEVGEISSLEHCAGMYNSKTREEELINFINNMKEPTLFNESLLLTYYSKKKYRPTLSKFRVLCEELMLMAKTDPRIQKRRCIIASILCVLFDSDDACYPPYFEAYLEIRGPRKEESISFFPNLAESKFNILAEIFPSKDYIERNVPRLLPLRHDFQVLNFLAMNRKLASFEMSSGLQPFVANPTPLYLKALYDSLAYFHKKEHKTSLTKLIQTEIEGLLKTPEAIFEAVRYFLQHHPTCSLFYIMVSRIHSKGMKVKSTKDSVNLLLRRIRNRQCKSDDQMHRKIIQQINKTVETECIVHVGELISSVRMKVANLFLQNPNDIFLYHNEKVLNDNLSVWQSFGFGLSATPTDIHISFSVGFEGYSSTSKESTLTESSQINSNDNKTQCTELLSHLKSQAERIFAFLPHTSILFRAIAIDYTPFLPLLSEILNSRRLPRCALNCPMALRFIFDYFLEMEPDRDYCFLLPLLKCLTKEQELPQPYILKVLYLVYRSNLFEHPHTIAGLEGATKEASVQFLRHRLLECMALNEDTEEEDSPEYVIESELYSQQCDILIHILAQHKQGLLTFCLFYHLDKFIDNKIILEKLMTLWGTLYQELSTQEKEHILNHLPTYMAAPNMSLLIHTLSKICLQPLFHARLLNQCVSLLLLIKKNKIRKNEDVVKNLLMMIVTLLGKNIECALIQSEQFMLCAIQLIYTMKLECPSYLIKIFEHVCRDEDRRKFLYKHFARDIEQTDWVQKIVLYRVKQRYNQQRGMVGLKNPHSVCYANSILQQLFHIRSFREETLGVNWRKVEPQDEDLMLQLKKIMLNLLHQHEPYINYDFFKAFKDAENESTAIDMQMDADEFRFVLLDRLQKLLPPDNNFIRRLFNGKQTTVIKSLQCDHPATRTQSDYSALCVEVKGFTLLRDSLIAYFQEEILEGQNAYECEQCKRKVRAVKHIQLDEYPPYLTFALKRFQYLVDRRHKINTRFQFPLEECELPTWNKEREVVKYRLRGVVIHQGVSEAGHYISLIKINGRWFQFNDSYVMELPPHCLQELMFGKDLRSMNSSKNAYLLFYEQDSLATPDYFLPTSAVNMEREEEAIKMGLRLACKENIYFDPNFLALQLHLCQQYRDTEGVCLLLQSLLQIFLKFPDDEEMRVQVAKAILFVAHKSALDFSLPQQTSIFVAVLQFITKQPYCLQKCLLLNFITPWPLLQNYIAFFQNCLQSNPANSEFYYALIQRVLRRNRSMVQSVNKTHLYELLCNTDEVKDPRDMKQMKNELKYHKWQLAQYLVQIDPAHEMWKLDAKKALEQDFGRVGLNCFAKLLAALCKNNKPYTQDVLLVLQTILLFETGEASRKCLRVLKELAFLQDTQTSQRMRQIVCVFAKIFRKHYESREPVLDSCWQFFLKIARKNHQFRREVMKFERTFEMLERLTSDHLHYFRRELMHRCEKYKMVYYGLKSPKIEQVQRHYEYLVTQTKSLLRGLPLQVPSEQDSDGDLSAAELVPDAPVRIITLDAYDIATVNFVFGDYLMILKHKEEPYVLHRASEKLANCNHKYIHISL